MTIKEEALQLRDKIVATAPSALVDAAEGDLWTVAILNAEAYFKVEAEDISEVEVEEKFVPMNKVLYFYNIDCFLNAWQTAAAITLFKTNKSLTAIGRILFIDTVTVKKILRQYFPIGDTKLTLTQLNRVAQRKTENPEVAEEIERLGWEPVTPTEKILKADVVEQELQSGSGLGDIAAKYGLSVLDVYNLVTPIGADALAEQHVSIIQEWMCGKTVPFIAEKLQVTVKVVCDALTQYGYYVMEGSNIHYVNYLLKNPQVGGGFNLRPSKACTGFPPTTYVTLPPVISNQDKFILQDHRSSPMRDLANMVGCRTEGELKKLCSALPVRHALCGEYVNIMEEA